jgi:hypothetical protein
MAFDGGIAVRRFIDEPVFHGECGAFPLEYRLDGKGVQASREVATVARAVATFQLSNGVGCRRCRRCRQSAIHLSFNEEPMSQRIEKSFLSRLSLTAVTSRLPVAAF